MKIKRRTRHYAEKIMSTWGEDCGSPSWDAYNEQDTETIESYLIELVDETIVQSAEAAKDISKPEYVQQSILSHLIGQKCIACGNPSGASHLCRAHARQPTSGAW